MFEAEKYPQGSQYGNGGLKSNQIPRLAMVETWKKIQAKVYLSVT